MSKVIKLNLKSEQIKHLTSNDEKFKKLYELVGDVSYELNSDGYSFLVYTIIGQMLSNKVADVISKRFLKLCDEGICTEVVSKLTADQMRALGLSYPKAGYIKNLTDAIEKGELNFESLNGMDDEEIIKEITKVKGLGKWSAKMFLIFVLGRENVLPYEDGAFLRAYSLLYEEPELKLKNIKARAKSWEPYSSTVARYFYKALDSGML